MLYTTNDYGNINITKPNDNYTRLQCAGALCHFSRSANSYKHELRKLVFSYIKTASIYVKQSTVG